MPPRDPESRFEQALARHLQRGAAPAGCLDPEILAAYHEGALTAAETATCKSHVAACARCQEVLGALEASDAVRMLGEEYVLAAATTAVAAAPMETAHGSGARKLVKDRAATKPLRLWRWLVPATVAVAAGLVVWVGVRETHRTAQAPVQVAMNSPANKPTEAVSHAEQALPPPAKPATPPVQEEAPRLHAPEPSMADEYRAVGGAVANPQGAPVTVARETPSVARPRLAPGTADLEKDQKSNGAVARLQVPSAVSAQEASAPAPPPLPTDRVAADYESKPARQKPTSVVNGAAESAQLGAARPAYSSKAKSPAGQEQGKQAVVTNAPPSAGKLVTLESLRERRTDELQKSAKGGVSQLQIAAPHGRVLWRTGAGGQIEKSSDGGASWTQQSSGVVAGLLAGAAPSEEVCWLVGRGGTVLRTTDGEHWTKVSFSFSVDLGGVSSSDALHALVWDTQNKVKYSTSDGGNSWTRIEGKQ
jgi:hypothetical protein